MASRDLPYSYNMEGFIIPYDRKDYYSIFEYLKNQAESLSGGKWTDFSDTDIGTVFLKLMSYLADMNNYHVDKATSELYLDTLLERSNAIALTKLIGFNPRHYQSAYTDITFTSTDTYNKFKYNNVIKAFSKYSDNNQTVTYYNLDDYVCKNTTKMVVRVYEGQYFKEEFTRQSVNSLGRLYLTYYNCAFNTVRVHVGDIELYQHPNVALTEGEYVYSIFVDESNRVYIQLPSFWKDVIDTTSVIKIEYLRSSGEKGRIGANVLTRVVDNKGFAYNSCYMTHPVSELGLDPETVEDIKISAPEFAKTMNTIVTLEDAEIKCRQLEGIADALAMDYTKYRNEPESLRPEALVEPNIPDGIPNDCYKLNLYVLPSTNDSIFKDGKLRDIKAYYTGTQASGAILDTSKIKIYAYYWNSTEIREINLTDCEYQIPTRIQTGDNIATIMYTEDDITCQVQIYIIGVTESDDFDHDNVRDWLFESVRAEYQGPTMQAGRALDISDIHVYASYNNLDEFEVEDWVVKDIDLNYDPNHIDADGLTDNSLTIYYMDSTCNVIVKAMQNDGIRRKMFTDEAQKMHDEVDLVRQSQIYVQYFDVDYIVPDILVDVYMDKYDLRWSETPGAIQDYICAVLSRERTRIGHNIIMSQLSAGILNSFTYLKYVEFRNPYMLDVSDPYWKPCPYATDPYEPHICKDPDKLVANSYEYLDIRKNHIVIRMNNA